MSALLKNKSLVLGVAGVAAFSAAYWFNKPADTELAVVQPVTQGTRNRTTQAALPQSSSLPLERLETPERGVISSKNQKDVFLPHSWLPPPPPPPPAPPPPAPTPPAPPPPPVQPVAPPVPFGFVGSLDEKAGVSRVFLSKGDQLLVAKVNDVIEGRYRIEQITESAVVLMYLPLNQKQTISIQLGGI